MRGLSIIILVLLLYTPSFAGGGLVLKNAWIREAPPGAVNLAGYGEFKNVGDETVTITSVSSPYFEKVSLHATSMHEGMMRMKSLPSLKLKPGELVSFKPGGKHLMLNKPKQRIRSGLMLPIAFKLLSGKTVIVKFEVRK
ncbi:MAG TPA: copper chaperone PCu(A)C [Gammaproteobacteria bacterium]|nr:copper chaperone PCu(A)C [Gammaproteobacteria bacterium]